MAGVRSRIQKRRTSVGFGSRLATGRQLPPLSFVSATVAVTYSRSPVSAPLGSRVLSSRIECDTVYNSFRVHFPRDSTNIIFQDPSSLSSKSREDEWNGNVRGRHIFVSEILSISWIRIRSVCFVLPRTRNRTHQEFPLRSPYRFLFSLEKLKLVPSSLSFSRRGIEKVSNRIEDRSFDRVKLSRSVADSSLSSFSITLR